MSVLSERLMSDLKEAMRSKDSLRKGVITLIRAGISKAEKEKKAALVEAEEVEVLQRELKQTKQTLAEGVKAGRGDIVEDSKKRIAVIESYLPEMMSEKEIINFLEDKGVQKGDNIGKVMGLLMKENKGKVDGSVARAVIQKHFG
ncbi:GatB/YqeY domain-containing protein [Bacillus subtilis]|uniref:GatB/YqeY domain-containing protein n=1 Tax=Bacillus subtilis TaxID=1423 RepID=UPI0021DA6217|nr:GatB/YqeY domain-containing protein [Bacillus subtilis]